MLKGFKWPLEMSDNGRLSVVEETDKIKQNGENIIETVLRERWYEPNQGTENYLGILRNFSNSDAPAIVTALAKSLNEQEPRAIWRVRFVEANSGGQVIFNIRFVRKDTQRIESFNKNIAEFLNA